MMKRSAHFEQSFSAVILEPSSMRWRPHGPIKPLSNSCWLPVPTSQLCSKLVLFWSASARSVKPMYRSRCCRFFLMRTVNLASVQGSHTAICQTFGEPLWVAVRLLFVSLRPDVHFSGENVHCIFSAAIQSKFCTVQYRTTKLSRQWLASPNGLFDRQTRGSLGIFRISLKVTH